MTFEEAFSVAMNNDEFKKHHENVQSGKETGCLLFAIGDEAFGYGLWDGGIHQIKHNPYTSTKLILHNKCLIISEGDANV